MGGGLRRLLRRRFEGGEEGGEGAGDGKGKVVVGLGLETVVSSEEGGWATRRAHTRLCLLAGRGIRSVMCRWSLGHYRLLRIYKSGT
jgi:hypothetical protein